MQVLIAYNLPVPSGQNDYACHAGVLDAVRHVAAALAELGYGYELMGVGAELREELAVIAGSSVDLVFNLCESIAGRSPLQACFAGYLELLGIPYTGSPAEAIVLATDKSKTKAMLGAAGIATPASWQPAPLQGNRQQWADLPFPLIVKPAREDGSIGIMQSAVVGGPGDLAIALEQATSRFGPHVLVEKYIAGRELSVSLLGNDIIRVLPISEACFHDVPADCWPIISYPIKWEHDAGEQLWFQRICPAALAEKLTRAIYATCQTAYRTMGLCGYGRIDLRLDADERPYIIDVNTNPDLTGYGTSVQYSATMPLAAKAAGIEYPELIELILQYARQRARYAGYGEHCTAAS